MTTLIVDGNVAAAGGYEPSAYVVEQVADTTSSVAAGTHEALIADPPFLGPDLLGLGEHAFTSNETIEVPSEEKEWTRKLQKEYDSLVAEEALETITGEQIARLDKLQELRRRLLGGVPGELLIRQWRERKAMNELLEAMQEYVRVIKRPH